MSGRRKNKRKLVLKKRFFVICILVVILALFLVVLGIKCIIGVFLDDESTGNNNQVSVTANKTTSDADVDTDENEISAFVSSTPAADSIENQINTAVMSSVYISPLSQLKSTIDDSFGNLIRYEDWNNGKIYYHSEFVDTMYVTYVGDFGEDNLPLDTAVCSSVSISLNYIKEFESFMPNNLIWGDVNHEEGCLDGEDYYFIKINEKVQMKVYCSEDGTVSQDSHIVVSMC